MPALNLLPVMYLGYNGYALFRSEQNPEECDASKVS